MMDRVRELVRRLRWLDLRSVLLPAGTVLLAVLALNGLFYFFLTAPRLRLAAGSRASFEQLNHRLEVKKREVEGVRDRLSLARCSAHDLERFRTEVLSTKVERMTRVQRSLRELARTFRMDPESIRYDVREMEDASLIGFGISFPLRGSYEDLRQFLQHVEESDHFLLIDSVGLSGSREGGAVLSLSIRLSTYFVDDSGPPGLESPGGGPRAGRRS